MNASGWSLLLTAGVSGMVTNAVRRYLLPSADWWNVVMILLLLMVLIAYLWREQHR